MHSASFSWFLAAVLVPVAVFAEGGKWTPEQVLQLDPAWLKSIGLEMPPGEVWKPEGGGLLDAVVQLPGCTAGFISAEGLLVTNHHCLFSILQQHSTPERDLITDGFLAARREDELPGASVRVTIPLRTTDVTAEVEAAARAAGSDDFARFQAIERKRKEIVAACEAQPNRRCQVAVYDDGVRYERIEALEYADVRLVYAPPRAVGEYGGEVDNWSWPRHTGDFAIARVYAQDGKDPAAYSTANRPYRPRRFFPLSTEGVQDGDFVMVAGYPGITYRSLIEAEMAERAELFFPRRAELYRAWIDLMERASESGETARIALADRMKTLANREKNSRGQVDGIARGRLLDKKRESDAAVLAWVAKHPAEAPALAAYRELEAVVQRKRETWEHDFLLSQAKSGPKPLAMALTLARWAVERELPDLEREPEYQERNRSRLREDLERDQKRLDPATENRLTVDLLGRFAALPAGQRVPAIDAFLAGAREPAAIAAKVEVMAAGTKVTDLPERLKMFDESRGELAARHDPLLDLALALTDDIRRGEHDEKATKGAISRLRPAWRRAVAAAAGKPIDPDANSTLRVSFARVRGYHPRDAVWMEPQTTFAGALAKNTGEEPFALPPALRQAGPAAAASRFADPRLKDLPVCFLATADTTGGNSGSPVLDARGELVGVNFDRVWENVANDFGYNPEVARNVSVDVRYLLWMLETLGGDKAKALLAELGVRR